MRVLLASIMLLRSCLCGNQCKRQQMFPFCALLIEVQDTRGEVNWRLQPAKIRPRLSFDFKIATPVTCIFHLLVIYVLYFLHRLR
jgi:hypothetical protein